MRRIAIHSFVITLLWLGFVCAISFMEAPVKFTAPGVVLKDALSIGRVVFHALNQVEWCACLLLWTFVAFSSAVRTRCILLLVGAITAILVWQTWGLFPPMEVRAVKILAGETLEPTWHHLAYIAVEIVKAFGLAALTTFQIKAYKRAITSQ